jgi:GAF domain-containing protein
LPVEDEYVRRQRAGSILCLPLVKRSKLIGVLYLEDKLTSQVFTTKRLVMLEPLASQAAIALHNARLYADLTGGVHRLRSQSAASGHRH